MKTMKKIALSFALCAPDPRDAWRQTSFRDRHLRGGENRRSVRWRLHHERRSGDDRPRGAARLEVDRGQMDGVSLDGLAVVAALAGDTNLGIHEIGGESTLARAALFPDARATPRSARRSSRWSGRSPGT